MDGITLSEFELCVVRRPMIEGDKPFIYSTWRNQAFYGAVNPHTQPSKIFFKKMTVLIKEILSESRPLVACLESDPDLVIGYSVSKGTHLYWVYVKKDYRNKGIASLLVPKDIVSGEWDQTLTGNAILKKKGLGHGRKED